MRHFYSPNLGFLQDFSGAHSSLSNNILVYHGLTFKTISQNTKNRLAEFLLKEAKNCVTLSYSNLLLSVPNNFNLSY